MKIKEHTDCIGMMWPLKPLTGTYDVACLISLIASTDGAIMEIGCNEGHTTRELALHFPDRKVIAVDTPETLDTYMQDLGRGFVVAKKARGLHNVIVLEENSQNLSDRDYYMIGKLVGKIGIVFIDAHHEYKEVVHDSMVAINYMRASGGGIVVWHDYKNHPDVTRYLDELDKQQAMDMFDHGLVWMTIKPTVIQVPELPVVAAL